MIVKKLEVNLGNGTHVDCAGLILERWCDHCGCKKYICAKCAGVEWSEAAIECDDRDCECHNEEIMP